MLLFPYFHFPNHFIGLCHNLLHCIFDILPCSLCLFMQEKNAIIIIIMKIIPITPVSIKVVSSHEKFSEKKIDMCN